MEEKCSDQEQVIGKIVHHIDHMFIGLPPMNRFQYGFFGPSPTAVMSVDNGFVILLKTMSPAGSPERETLKARA